MSTMAVPQQTAIDDAVRYAGFSIVLASLLVAAFALCTDNKVLLQFAAAAMLWGHYWDASN